MNQAIRSIVRFTVLEAWRSRWFALCTAGVVLVATLVAFVGAMAITQRTEVMLSTAAIASRLVCMALVILMTVSATVRETQDRIFLIVLSSPIPRHGWIAARAAGLALVAAATACVLSIPLWGLNPGWGVAAWTTSLIFEAMLASLLSLTIALAIRQIAAAVLASALFYLAARVIGIVQMLNDRAPLDTQASQALVSGFLEVLALALPRLDLFTMSAWVVPGGPAVGVGGVAILAGQAMLYSGLLIAAASFDLTRRDQMA
jgi:ABC-type Na+ efflux pump permease subunit